MTDDPNLLLISGLPRSGTTLLINWLGDAWPGDKIWLSESGLTNLAFHTYRLYDFNAKGHETGINFSSTGTQRKEALLELRRWIIALYRLKTGNADGTWILDKMPMFLHYADSFYQAMIEIFPKLKLILIIRNYEEVITSMMNRKWARGPFPKSNLLSPFFDDMVGRDPLDVYLSQKLDKSGERPVYINEQVKWSFHQCCRNYANGIRGVYATLKAHPDTLVLDYSDLADVNSVQEKISDYTGIPIQYPFVFKKSRRKCTFNKVERQIVRQELEETGICEMYRELSCAEVKE